LILKVQNYFNDQSAAHLIQYFFNKIYGEPRRSNTAGLFKAKQESIKAEM
jgi:hypothetical protein